MLPFPDTNEYLSGLTSPDPECQKTVQYEVEHAGCSRVVFGGIPTEFPVGIKCRGRYSDSGIANGEANICIIVRLLECVWVWELREVGREGVVGCILQIY